MEDAINTKITLFIQSKCKIDVWKCKYFVEQTKDFMA